MSKIRYIAVAILVVAIAGAMIYLRPRRHEATAAMAGNIPVRVVAWGRTPSQFRDDLDAARQRIAEISAVFDRHNDGSELSRMNREAAVAPFAMSEPMARLFAASVGWHKATGGLFDPTVGPLVDLWEAAADKGAAPTPAEIAKAKRLVGLDFVSIASNGRVLYSRDGMSLDFGAIAKGAIADAAADVLKKRGVSRGLVEAGGDAVAFGPGTFRFGVQDPQAKAGEKLVGTIDAKEGAVVTSGDYARFAEIGGKRYSHIIDPKTGAPAGGGIVSATVVGGSAMDADAIATALMVMELADAIAFINARPELAAVLVQRSASGSLDAWISRALVPVVQLGDAWKKRAHVF